MTATHFTASTVVVAIDISKHRTRSAYRPSRQEVPSPHDDYEHAGRLSALGHRSRQLRTTVTDRG